MRSLSSPTQSPHALQPSADTELEARFVAANPRSVLEIGAWDESRVARWAKQGARLRNYTVVEPSENPFAKARIYQPNGRRFKANGIMAYGGPAKGSPGKPSIRLIKGSPRHTLGRLVAEGGPRYDFILFKGARSFEAIRAEWGYAKQLLSPNGLCIFENYFLESGPFGCKRLIDGLDTKQWKIDFLGGIQTAENRYFAKVSIRGRPGNSLHKKMQAVRVRFIGTMLAKGYSGGRLLALTFAEALATTGATVDFLVSQLPEMYLEFASFSRINVTQFKFDRLSDFVDRSIDVVVIVPGQGNPQKHSEFLRHAIECHAKIILLNFESPNWFNSVSPFKRDPNLWEGWDIISQYADFILSISAEGNKWAKEYYSEVKPDCQFGYCYTAINSVVADTAPAIAPRLKQIVMLTRVDPHKGLGAMQPFIHRDFAGFKLLVCIGSGEVPADLKRSWRDKFGQVGVDFEIRGPVIGYEKFVLLKSSSLLYFPSRFEGFGIPPLEAAYCLLPTVCSDLPVLREFGQDAFFYADPEDLKGVRAAALAAMASPGRLVAEHPRIASIARLEDCGRRLAEIIRSVC